MTGLEGRVVLVTGAARGIGAAVADAFGAAGAAVAIGDVDASGATTVATRVGDTHGVATLAVELDVTSRPDVDAALAKVQAELGALDVLVNNAGIDVIKPFIESTPEEWERILAVNLTGLFNCCQAALVGMVEREQGAIVNFASDAGPRGFLGRSRLLSDQGRCRRVHEDPGARDRPPRHPRELREPGAHRHRPARPGRGPRSQVAATRWRAASRCAGWVSPPTSHRRSSSSPATAPATSPGRRSP